MDSDKIKNSFSLVKQDIFFLSNEIQNIKQDILNLDNQVLSIKELFSSISQDLKELKLSVSALYDKPSYPTDKQTHQQTIQHIIPTNINTPTHNPTLPQEVGGLKSPILDISTGNEGVPTDKQTNRQTDQQTQKIREKSISEGNIETNIQKATEILDSLDQIKREIRSKFKRLTPQEMSVFSTIYQLESEDPDNTIYKEIAKRLKLSESSIRDYVLRMISKGIPIKKRKINNKKILLSISPDLKKIATLSTILQLRDL